MRWLSWVSQTLSARCATAIANAVIATHASTHCHVGRPDSPQTRGIVTAVPHVPGAIGEYPAPNAVANIFTSVFTSRNIRLTHGGFAGLTRSLPAFALADHESRDNQNLRPVSVFTWQTWIASYF